MSEEVTARPERPPLAERLRSGLEETLAWTQNQGEARVTLLQEDARRVGPQPMTFSQFEAEHAQQQTIQPSANQPLMQSEANALIQELLAWTGRAPSSEEKEIVDTLRKRADDFLQQASVSSKSLAS